MKKILISLLVLVTMFTITGCGDNKDTNNTNNEVEYKKEEKLNWKK